MKTKEELITQNSEINFKELVLTDDHSKAYFGFENEKVAKNFVDYAILSNLDKLYHPKVVTDISIIETLIKRTILVIESLRYLPCLH